jgi:hypothetical protein
MKSLSRRLTAAALAQAKGKPRVRTELASGNGFAMDARTDIKTRLPSRDGTKGPERAPHRFRDAVSHENAATGRINAALRPSMVAHQYGTGFGTVEIFKKTPYVADLKRGGRDVAKDISEIGKLPVLKKTLLDNDADIGALNVKLTDAEPAGRKTKWKPRKTNHTSGALGKYARQVGAAADGAVTHPGGAHEKQCYADI